MSLSVDDSMNGWLSGGPIYNDFLLLPGKTDFSAADVIAESRITRNVVLQTPFTSNPMDTVTKTKMTISLALLGGIAALVRTVKRQENGFITDPVVLSPTRTVAGVLNIKARLGFCGIPITDSGFLGGKLLGIVTSRDIQFGFPGVTLNEASFVLLSCKKGKLPIVDDQGRLTSFLARSDLLKNQNYPLSSTNFDSKQLYVAAAVGIRPNDRERPRLLVEAGLVIVVLGSSQGSSIYQLEMVQWIKQTFSKLEVIAGNVVTHEQAAYLVAAGADGLRVCMGSGSILGRPPAMAVYAVAEFANKPGIPVIADGAFALVASAVMMDGLLAGTTEAPGEYFYHGGKRVKAYGGMGSLEAMDPGKSGPSLQANGRPGRTKHAPYPKSAPHENAATTRYFSENSTVRVAQGVSGDVQDRGSVEAFDIGVKIVEDLKKGVQNGSVRFELRTARAQVEGGVHRLRSYTERLFT
ncbi:IMP dehydrogenase/GMP reductase [Pisolithus croceorrhizus]|nr:IMP dehydrogenase/GMP reductase [Pisolithus croceorrhizus]KAI6111736.1 IMP dehydrogenase/GMP reductase [Pisolithus croceorrhizus]KAI6152722.1 IMP dehydrogenase/GMP reductase [Pisolithus thermaeus]